MKIVALSALALTLGLIGCTSTMAAEIHIIVKNGFRDADTTIMVQKPVDTKDAKIESDTASDGKLFPPTIGKSVGELVFSHSGISAFTKSVTISTSSMGDCNINFSYASGNFSYAGESGKACGYATTILKNANDKYFLIVEFSEKHK